MTDTAVEPVASTDLAASAAHTVHDLSIWGMFMQADLVVKSVMIMLLLASFWCWTIIFNKWTKFKDVQSKCNQFEKKFWSANALDSFYDSVKNNVNHPLAAVFVAAMEEWYRAKWKDVQTISLDAKEALRQRMSQLMLVARNQELSRLEKNLGFLATVGSTAPFIGLFGTVWGIMNSFQSIAAQQNTSLAVVAPGIAEALLATAIGLFAAIPAVVAYNRFSNDLRRVDGQLEDFCHEFDSLISRQLEGRG